MFDVVDFNKYASSVDPYYFGFSGVSLYYYRCPECGFMFTPFFDDWSASDFSRYIYNSDYIKIDGEYVQIRPQRFASLMQRTLDGNKNLRLLDYGSGAGVFVEEMRKAGYSNCEGYDPFFNPTRPDGLFDVITCFEVIEHSTRPYEMFLDMKSSLAEGGCIIFSQALQPDNIKDIRCSWWYVAPRNGHVSFFTEDSLANLGSRTGLLFFRGDGIYAFYKNRPSSVTSHIASGFSSPLYVMNLLAPSADEPSRPREWHGVECGSNGSYRWSSGREIKWSVPRFSYAGTVRFVLPYLSEIAKNYAGGCVFELDGVQKKAILSRSHDVGKPCLSVEFPANEGDAREVKLILPEPIVPSRQGAGRDSRALGLAVRLAF